MSWVDNVPRSIWPPFRRSETFETEQRGDVTVVRVIGDIRGIKDERKLRVTFVNCNSYKVVVNLSQMKLLSYMGVGIFMEYMRKFRFYDGDMKLVGMNINAQRLFRMLDVARFFKTFDSEAEAIESFNKADQT